MKNKTCKTCQMEKTEDNFYVHRYKNGTEYLSSNCKPCYNSKIKLYVSANKEKIAASKKNRRDAHRDEINRSAREKHKLSASIVVDSLPLEKVCCKCKILKSRDNFYFQKNAFNGGLSWTCKACRAEDGRAYRTAHPKVVAAIKKKYREDNRERLQALYRQRHKSVGMKRKYGLCKEQYDSLILAQNNSCAVCQIVFVEDGRKTNFGVDHCHSTKKVRALLCKQCNSAIGLVKENVVILSKMIEYLKTHKGEESNGKNPNDLSVQLREAVAPVGH